MSKLLKGIGVIGLVFMITGCGVTKGVSVRGYKEDKPRVDQDIQGRVGNWENAPLAVDAKIKDTRRVYVLEVSKEAKEGEEIQKAQESPSINSTSLEEQSESLDMNSSTSFDEEPEDFKNEIEEKRSTQRISLPIIDIDAEEESGKVQAKIDVIDDEDASSMTTSFEATDYVVEKDDTLQKISKKFYGSYSKWIKIYEANKDKITNPDKIKPGITIRIPSL